VTVVVRSEAQPAVLALKLVLRTLLTVHKGFVLNCSGSKIIKKRLGVYWVLTEKGFDPHAESFSVG
jgi:hypothetical protein